MKFRLPRPLWFAIPTVVLLVVAVGLSFGQPAYRQWSALELKKAMPGLKVTR